MIINTSFNVRGEPLVCSPQDAFRCFMKTEMDVLVIENFVLIKSEQTDAAAQSVDAPVHKKSKNVTDRQARNTCLVVSVVLLAAAALFFYRERLVAAEVAVSTSLVLAAIAIFIPWLARLFHTVWMGVASILGWVNSRIILSLIYFLLFVPYGLISRLVGRDPLAVRQQQAESYWTTRQQKRQAREQFERLF